MVKYQVGDFTFELDHSEPLYEQILDQIRHAIARGDVQLGTKLPSVRDLAQQLKLNPSTVMKAYQELERTELSETRKGQGTYITNSEDKVLEVKKTLAQSAVHAFTSSMKDLGINRKIAKELLEEVDW